MDAATITQVKVVDGNQSALKATQSTLPEGQVISAKVAQITANPTAGTSHIVTLQTSTGTLQVSANFPATNTPEPGSTVTLQRHQGGQIELTITANKQTSASIYSSRGALANSSVPSAINTTSNSIPSAGITQQSGSQVILNAPVTINASGSVLKVIEQTLPTGVSVAAKVVSQGPTAHNSVTPTAVTSGPSTQSSLSNTLLGNVANTPATTSITTSAPPTLASTLASTVTPTTPQNSAAQITQIPASQSAALHSAPSQTVSTPAAANPSTATAPAATAQTTSPQTPTTQTTGGQATSHQAIAPSTANAAATTANPAASTAAAATAAAPSPVLTASASSSTNGASNTVTSNSTLSGNISQQSASSQGTSVANTPALSTPTAPATLVQPAALPSTNVATPTMASTNPSAGISNNSPIAPNMTTSNTSSTVNQNTATPAVNIANTTAPLATPSTNTLPTSQQTTTTTASITPTTIASTTPATTASTSASTASATARPTANQTAPIAPATTQSATTATLSNTVSDPTAPAAPKNLQLNALAQQSADIKISVAGQVISLQAPANLPNVQNLQIVRSEGLQANISWQQPTQAATPNTPVNNFSLSPKQAQLVEHNLRQALPQQIPVAEGINQLVAQTSQMASVNTTAINSVDKIALSIMSMFGVKPGSSTASDTIKRNVQQGGMFSENKMVSQPSALQGDMKNFLSKLNNLAEQLPVEQKEMLQGTVEKIQARVTAQQLTHIQQQHTKADASLERSFQIDIPVQNSDKLDNVPIEIKQRKHLNEQGEFISVWSVKLHFDLAAQGEVDVEVALNPTDNSISTTFLCSRQSTVQTIEGNMQKFRQQLTQQGFDIQTLHCSQGSQAATANNHISKRIIDIRT